MYNPQSFLPDDLDMFFTNFSSELVGMRPKVMTLNGGTIQSDQLGMSYDTELNLDLTHTMALVYPQNVTLYQAGNKTLFNQTVFDNLLTSIDGFYCHTRGNISWWMSHEEMGAESQYYTSPCRCSILK